MKRRKNELEIGNGCYEVKRLQICPFEKIKCGESNLIHPLRNEGYPFVLCVSDLPNNRVIEIVNGHSYEYIPLISGLMLNKVPIVDQKRYAICPVYVSEYELTSKEIDCINKIIVRLKQDNDIENSSFVDGNYVMTNEEYKDSILEYEKIKEGKVKRLKRGKHEYIRNNR